MKDADLKRNASGYYDEPCYKAITAPPKAGEIWSSRDGTKYWLILQNHGGVCSILLLGTEQKEGSITVMGRVPMYTTPVMVGYTFSVYVATFVKRVPDEKMTEIRQAVGEALGITGAAAVPHDHSNKLESDMTAMINARDRLAEENEMLKKKLDEVRKEAAVLNCEPERMRKMICEMQIQLERANLYKELYAQLIDKLVSVRGGAIVND